MREIQQNRVEYWNPGKMRVGSDSGDDFRRGLKRPLRGFPIAAGGQSKVGKQMLTPARGRRIQ